MLNNEKNTEQNKKKQTTKNTKQRKYETHCEVNRKKTVCVCVCVWNF